MLSPAAAFDRQRAHLLGIRAISASEVQLQVNIVVLPHST